nr:MAG TPA: hypothetical protein [Caudoviricetes sp.]
MIYRKNRKRKDDERTFLEFNVFVWYVSLVVFFVIHWSFWGNGNDNVFGRHFRLDMGNKHYLSAAGCSSAVCQTRVHRVSAFPFISGNIYFRFPCTFLVDKYKKI